MNMFNKFKGLIRKTNIKMRLFLGFILVPIFLMFIWFSYYYSSNREILLEKHETNANRVVSMSEELFQVHIDHLNKQMYKLIGAPYVRNFLYYPTDESIYLQFVQGLHEHNILEEYTGLRLLDANENQLYKEGNINSLEISSLKDEILKQGENGLWRYDETNDSIIQIIGIYDLYNQPIGYLLTSYEKEIFNSSILRMEDDSLLVVTDEKGNCLFESLESSIQKPIDLSASIVEIDQISYYLTKKENKDTSWYVVYLSKENAVLAEIYSYRDMLLIYGMVFLLVVAIIAYFIYRSMIDPINKLLQSMRNIDESNLALSQIEDNGKDEIHELNVNFNDLLNRVQELLETIEKEQEMKRESQFQLLQAQINPHFLFNTLNTLKYLAILNEDKPVSEGINALAKLLRNTILDSKEMVSVQDEIENVKNYIIIQKLRYGDVFETVYNIDNDVLDCVILKFLLQPIVENSILHAFEEDKEHQILTIRVKKEGEFLKIEIGDNGKGFKITQTETRYKKLSGIGVKNVQERIHLMYGEKYSMDIKSVIGKGTIVTLLLPYKKSEG